MSPFDLIAATIYSSVVWIPEYIFNILMKCPKYPFFLAKAIDF